MRRVTPPSEFDLDTPFERSFTTRAVNRQQYNVEFKLPPESIRYNTDQMFGEALARVTAYIYAEDLGVYNHEWTYPTTWWDHFKRDHMPKWFVERYPVQYTTHSKRLDAKAMFPQYRPPNGYSQVQYVIREMNEYYP